MTNGEVGMTMELLDVLHRNADDSSASVMLVDDEEYFARVYIPIWEKISGIDFVYARDAQTAKTLLANNPIKVVILDQIMPVSGIELFSQLKSIDNRIKTVLLSGEMKEGFVEAPRIGFNYTLLKNEKDLDSLPSVVLGLISEYNSDTRKKNIEDLSDFYVFKKKGIFFWQPKYEIRYSVIDYNVIEEEKVIGDWHTSAFLQAGQEMSSESEISFQSELQFTDNFSIENEKSLNISSEILGEFKKNLALKMENTFAKNYSQKIKEAYADSRFEKVEEVFRRTNKISIPSDSSDLISRSYEYAKLARIMKVYLRVQCSCCNCSSIEPITVMIPLPKVKFRIVDHYKDNTTNIVDAGDVR